MPPRSLSGIAENISLRMGLLGLMARRTPSGSLRKASRISDMMAEESGKEKEKQVYSPKFDD